MELINLSLAVALTTIIMSYLPVLFEPSLPPIVEGYFQPEFMDVAETLRKNMESGKEMGAAFAVYRDGEPIIDMWAGYADRAAQQRWRNETITLGFSVTKSLMGVLYAVLVDRGYVSYGAPIIDFWKAFGENNKDNITLEMFLSHQAGLATMDSQINLRDLKKKPEMIEGLLAKQKTAWPAGHKHGYHTYTYGLYLDKLIEKIDPKGRDTETVFQEEIAKPFDIDFHMNLPREEVYRAARLHRFSLWRNLWDIFMIRPYRYFSLYYRFFTDTLVRNTTQVIRELLEVPFCFNNQELREITQSAVMGTGTARGLAKLYSILASGGTYKGKQLLSPEVIQQLSSQITSGDDVIFPTLDMQWGRGVLMMKNPFGDPVFGGVGYGGQVVVADPVNKLGIAYLSNYVSVFGKDEDPRFTDLYKAVYKNIDRYVMRFEKNA